MPSPPTLLPLLLLMLLSAVAASASNDQGSQVAQAEVAGSSGPARRRDLVPVAPRAELGAMALGLMNETARRKLAGSFQLCAPCTCCGGSRGACVLSPCCYSINCNIPNRPFGFWNALNSNPDSSIFYQLLPLFPKSQAVQILLFKFQYYQRLDVHSPVPPRLFRAAALLIKSGFIDLDNIFSFTSNDDQAIEHLAPP